MKTGIRTRFFLWSVALIGVTLVVAGVITSMSLDAQLTGRIRDDLLVRARLISERLSGSDLGDARVLDSLAGELGRAAGGRVTIVRVDGTVAGDSEVEGGQLAFLENHASRPEVVDALEKGEGSSERYSSTLGQRMMYVAVPIKARGVTVGTARVATPLNAVERALAELHKTLAVGALFALALATVLSFTAADVLSRRLRELTEAARKMASGNLATRTRAGGGDEIATLGGALDALAESLSRSLDELRGERDVLSGILSSMHEGVLVVGADRRIVLLNPALRNMLLVGPDAAGKPVLHVLRNSELNQLLEGAARGEDAEVELELGGLKPRRVLARAVTLNEAPGGVLVVFVDVTELRRLEAVRRDFVANASHELRSPLTTVRAAVETLHAVKNDPVEASRFIELIERNTERIENLVSDLLELARLESRDLDLHLETLDLAAAVERILARHAVRAEMKKIELVNAVPGTTHVKADSRALDHMIGNLVDNALKYCPEGSTVRVSAQSEDSVVRASVADTGPGIPPQHLPRLFERFYRVDTGRSRELGGTGLGLSIVKHLAEAMGGSVAVESQVGSGSVFSFTLQRS
jgi:two-component system phosphate regulon sensor histidine kinase PhoR